MAIKHWNNPYQQSLFGGPAPSNSSGQYKPFRADDGDRGEDGMGYSMSTRPSPKGPKPMSSARKY